MACLSLMPQPCLMYKGCASLNPSPSPRWPISHHVLSLCLDSFPIPVHWGSSNFIQRPLTREAVPDKLSFLAMSRTSSNSQHFSQTSVKYISHGLEWHADRLVPQWERLVCLHFMASEWIQAGREEAPSWNSRMSWQHTGHPESTLT
jgi:hypothetical protein